MNNTERLAKIQRYKSRSIGTSLLEFDGEQLAVTFRKMPPRLFGEMNIEKPPAKMEDLTTEERKAYIKSLMENVEVIFPVCILDPPIIFGSEDEPGSLHFDDLDYNHVIQLFTDILTKTGVGSEQVAQREGFPVAPSEETSES